MTTDLSLRLPTSVEELLPPKSSSLVAEAESFLRNHWNDVVLFQGQISGTAPSKHGSINLDEAAFVFKVQDLVKQNGSATLREVNAATLQRALRLAYKRCTGDSFSALKQYNREHREEQRAAQ